MKQILAYLIGAATASAFFVAYLLRDVIIADTDTHVSRFLWILGSTLLAGAIVWLVCRARETD